METKQRRLNDAVSKCRCRFRMAARVADPDQDLHKHDRSPSWRGSLGGAANAMLYTPQRMPASVAGL
jgi:hypothetical protein